MRQGRTALPAATRPAEPVDRVDNQPLVPVDENITTTDPFAMVELWSQIDNDQAVLLEHEFGAMLNATDEMGEAVRKFLKTPEAGHTGDSETDVLEALRRATSAVHDVSFKIRDLNRGDRPPPEGEAT